MTGTTEVTRTYLELKTPGDLRPAPTAEPAPRIERLEPCSPAIFRYLYAEVGRAFQWTDRLAWSDETIQRHLGNPGVSIWLMSEAETPAGYFELRRHADQSIEVAYFGLMGDYIGRGLGGWLLTRAAETAWAEQPSRVWLHTCTLDHPNALPNYLRRGFRAVREEIYTVEP